MFPARFLLVSLATALACSQLSSQEVPVTKAEIAEEAWSAHEKEILASLKVPPRVNPSETIWVMRINHQFSLSDLGDNLELWIDKKSNVVHVWYQTAFLVGYLRQLALLQPDPNASPISKAVGKVRMMEIQGSESDHPELNLRKFLGQFQRLRFPISNINLLTGPAAKVDGCYLHIEATSGNSYRFIGAPDDSQLDQLVENFCESLRRAWVRDHLSSIGEFLSKDCITHLGPDFLSCASQWPEFSPLAVPLLKLGVDPNQSASTGDRPLVGACLSGNFPLVQSLLARGADPNKGSHSEVWPNQDFMPIDAAVNAVESGSPNGLAIIKLLLQSGASPNRFGSGYGSPLARARQKNNKSLVDLLLKSGAKE